MKKIWNILSSKKFLIILGGVVVLIGIGIIIYKRREGYCNGDGKYKDCLRVCKLTYPSCDLMGKEFKDCLEQCQNNKEKFSFICNSCA